MCGIEGSPGGANHGAGRSGLYAILVWDGRSRGCLVGHNGSLLAREKSRNKTALHSPLHGAGGEVVSFIKGSLSLHLGAGRFYCLCQSELPQELYVGSEPFSGRPCFDAAGCLQWSTAQRNRRNCKLCPEDGPGDYRDRPHYPANLQRGICAVSGAPLTGAERASYFLRGCAGTSDQRERKSHAIRRVRPGVKRPVLGLGGTSTSASGYRKRYPDAMLADVIGTLTFLRPKPLKLQGRRFL